MAETQTQVDGLAALIHSIRHETSGFSRDLRRITLWRRRRGTPGDTLAPALARADQFLHPAKAEGRDRVRAW